MADIKLQHNEKLDIENILKDLDQYTPRRKGWTWRKPVKDLKMGPFTYRDASEPLENGVPLPPAKIIPFIKQML